MNGMMGDPTGGAGGDWMSNQPHQQPIWGDPMKQEQEFFKHQQQVNYEFFLLNPFHSVFFILSWQFHFNIALYQRAKTKIIVF